VRLTIIALLSALLPTAVAYGDENAVKLKQAPGVDQVEANCAACHSLDYVQMNSTFLSAVAWDAEVAKMINVFGAPIDSATASRIGNYLKDNYGK
jgi:sulfite dehydrogenase (cytochrome) subunit B